ncbi:MAG TPA: NAD(P)H-quinone oxidoreductase [Acidiferrobacterales bacterium]|nr:NAD(P)H-quinone oxidoreductase [Acidiferrobacterales bacterium]
MKAIIVKKPGAVLAYGDAPDPKPNADELLIRVRATAVNRADILQRMGRYPPPPGASDILGLEAAGEVVVPKAGWKVGDRVMAVITGGGYAELATVPASQAMPVPPNLGFEQAAAVPEAFLTAYLNLFIKGGLRADETVLIHAGASGVGTAAIQLAHVAGARVVVTAGSTPKLARCRELGADIAIDYKKESFAEKAVSATGGKGVDLILDFIGAPYWENNLTALAVGGRLALIGFLGGSAGQLDLAPLLMKRLTVSAATLRRLPPAEKTRLVKDFAAFALGRFEREQLKPVVDSIYALKDAVDAHRAMEANRNIGKIVLKV